MLKSCKSNVTDFFGTIIECLKRDNFELEMFLNTIEKDVYKSITTIEIYWYPPTRKFHIEPYKNVIWTQYFHKMYGPCFSADISRIGNLSNILLDENFGLPRYDAGNKCSESVFFNSDQKMARFTS